MKVLQISKFYHPVRGGIETVAWELTEGLNRAGIRTDVLCSAQQLQSSVQRFAAGYDVRRAGSLGMVLSTSMSPAMIGHLRRLADDHDIVHVHMPDPMAALALWVVRPRVRVVVHWHSDVVRQRSALLLYRPLEQWLLRRADAVIATSAAYADSSASLSAWRDKVSVVPIGTPESGVAQPRRIQALRDRFPGKRLVFSLGRMAYYKGWDVLIEAARALPDDVVVVVGGGGPDLGRYRDLALRRGVAGKAVFLGPLSAANAEAAFAAAELFCMASTVRAEAYGVAVLEAMARGVPVVATDIPGSGLGWLQGHGVSGLTVPPGDPAALAAAISTLLADPALRTQCGKAARARWAEHFTVDAMVASVLALYRRLLSEDASPQAPR